VGHPPPSRGARSLLLDILERWENVREGAQGSSKLKVAGGIPLPTSFAKETTERKGAQTRFPGHWGGKGGSNKMPPASRRCRADEKHLRFRPRATYWPPDGLANPTLRRWWKARMGRCSATQPYGIGGVFCFKSPASDISEAGTGLLAAGSGEIP